MNVQTSTLNGYNNLCIPPDTLPSTYPDPGIPTDSRVRCEKTSYFGVPNDSAAENGPYTPQLRWRYRSTPLHGLVAHRGR